MTSDALRPYFLGTNDALNEAGMQPEDELLHPKQNALVRHPAVTETQYFGFSVPQERIHALAMISHRPHVGVVTGGVFAWQGIKRDMVAAELCDMVGFMDDASLRKSDLHNYRLDNGYGVQVIEPMKRLRMTYVDAARKNSIDLEYAAISPAVMFQDGNHFEQAMSVRGELVLRGKRYDVDCTNVRDRSWGRARPEVNLSVPPVSWMIGAFNDDFSFNCCMFDHASGNPEVTNLFEVPDDKILTGGWVYRHGNVSRIKQAHKKVARDRHSLLPFQVELDVVDEMDRRFAIRGSHVAACPWQVWPNFRAVFSLMKWECDGHTTFNDCQDGFWNDYLNHFLK